MSHSYIGERGPFRKANRSAFVNFLKSKYEMYTGALEVGSYPYYLTIDPSDACQLRCPTCPTGIENESRKSRDSETLVYREKRAALTPELFEVLLNEMGEYLFMILFYNYGEPLLNRQLPQLIRRAKRFDIEVDINTNLSLPLSDGQIEDLLSSGVDYVYCSIDGFSQDTYEIHRVGGSFGLVKDNLERLAKIRDRLGLDTSITYNFLVFSFNEHEIPAARSYCRGLGVNFNTREAIIHHPDWLPSYRRKEKPVLIEDGRWSTFRLPSRFSHSKGHDALAWLPFPAPRPARRSPACAWHYGYSVVTAAGAIAPCCGVPGEEYDFGRVGPGGGRFRDVWNNDRLHSSRAAFAGEARRQGTEVDTICATCPLPKFMHHMYSLHDFKVLAEFERALAREEPLLGRAFGLYGRSRYGRLVHALYRRGYASPILQLLAGNGDEGHMEEFVRFCESNLMDEFRTSATDPG